jgi:sensor c-di-GMP phosphodiesterase-like protein
VLPGKRKLAAAVVGILLAGAPVLFVQYLLDRYIQRQGHLEVEITAKRGMTLAESRVRRVIAGLTELGNRAIASCRGADLTALDAAMFDVWPIKELAVVGPGGETLCSNVGLPLGPRSIISRQTLAFAANIAIELLRIPERSENMVRIRRMNPDGGDGLAALLPAELFIPQVSTHGGPMRVRATMTMRDGTVIGESGAKWADGDPDEDRVVVVTPSDHYGLEMTTSMSRASLTASHGELRTFAAIGSGCVAVLMLALALLARWRQRADPISEIRRALEADEFVPYYQPILDITNGRLEGAEVLIRWRKPDGSIIPPGSFIPLLESSGLIFDVTRALMRRVCREAGPVIGRRRSFKISFNLTARHFAEDVTVADIRDIFSGSPIALSQLVVEVTERHPLESLAAARRVIASLQELGVRVAIDDVGAGHGGLSYLLKLGVDIIKIDKLFVDAIGAERHSAAIIRSLVELARSMRMDIVAEGVENFEQVAYLRDHGIRLAQGYVFAPPLPGSSFLRLVEATDPVPTPVPDSTRAASVPRYISARNRAALA